MKQLLFSFLLLLFAAAVGASTRRALLIGLSEQADPSWSRIHGENDVRLMKNMVTNAGFTDISVLVNREATKQGIVQALERLASRCAKGDVVYIHYSGHGQMISDLDGDEALRHPGKRHARWDESLVPYDARLVYGPDDRGEKHLTDDELSRHLGAIRKRLGQTGRLYVVLDACHSGDGTNGPSDEPARGVDTEFVIPRNAPVPAKPAAVTPDEWMTVSACRPYQVCFEQSKPKAGKLTLALFGIGPQMFRLSAANLQKRLQDYIDRHPGRLPQNPVVTGKP